LNLLEVQLDFEDRCFQFSKSFQTLVKTDDLRFVLPRGAVCRKQLLKNLLDHLLVVIELLVVVLLLGGVTLNALASEHADSQTVILIQAEINQ